MTPDEEKALELAANGKRIIFHTRHHWILTWLEEQEGKNLADKVWRVIDGAYRADYKTRGHAAMGGYWRAFEAKDYDAAQASLCEAIEYFGRAGDSDGEQLARDMLRGIVLWLARQAT